jgi:DNA-binding XRE family transcriptional regulator
VAVVASRAIRPRLRNFRPEVISLAAIARALGVSKQVAHQLLGYRGPRPSRLSRRRKILCPDCGASLGLALSEHDIAPALCLPCLDRRPGAALGERLRALRHAARLLRDRLARKAGLSAGAIGYIERGRSQRPSREKPPPPTRPGR